MMLPKTLGVVATASLLGLSSAAGLKGHDDEPARWLHKRLAANFAASAQTISSSLDYLSCQLRLETYLAFQALGGISTTPMPDCNGHSLAVALVATAISPVATPHTTVATTSTTSTSTSTSSTTSTTSASAAVQSVDPKSSARLTQIPTPQQDVLIDPLNPCSSDDENVCWEQFLALESHNTARLLHNATALTWNDTLADAALSWAKTCVWGHSRGSLFPSTFVYGENIYASTQGVPATNMTTAVTGFMNEQAAYNYSAPGFSDLTGHFTQVVWQETRQVGCAIVTCDLALFSAYTNASTYAVCVYEPSGNFAGEFAANVFPPSASLSSI